MQYLQKFDNYFIEILVYTETFLKERRCQESMLTDILLASALVGLSGLSERDQKITSKKTADLTQEYSCVVAIPTEHFFINYVSKTLRDYEPQKMESGDEIEELEEIVVTVEGTKLIEKVCFPERKLTDSERKLLGKFLYITYVCPTDHKTNDCEDPKVLYFHLSNNDD